MSNRLKGALLTSFGVCGVSPAVSVNICSPGRMDSTWLVPIRLFCAGVLMCLYFFDSGPEAALFP